MARRAPLDPDGDGPSLAHPPSDTAAEEDLFGKILAEAPEETVRAHADDGARLRDFFHADRRDRQRPDAAPSGAGGSGWPANNYGPAYWTVHEERKKRGLRRPTELRRGVRSDAELWDVDELAGPAPEREGAPPPREAAAPDLPWRRPPVDASRGPDAWLEGLDDRLDGRDTAATEARLVGLLHGASAARTLTLVEAAETLYARPAGLTGGARLVDGREGARHAVPPTPSRRARTRPVMRRLAVVTPAAAAVGTFLGMVLAAFL